MTSQSDHLRTIALEAMRMHVDDEFYRPFEHLAREVMCAYLDELDQDRVDEKWAASISLSHKDGEYLLGDCESHQVRLYNSITGWRLKFDNKVLGIVDRGGVRTAFRLFGIQLKEPT